VKEKQELADQCSEIAGIDYYELSPGSTITRPFLVALAEALGIESGNESRPKIAEAIVVASRGQWTTACDSTSSDSGGGGTITNEGMRRVLEATQSLVAKRSKQSQLISLSEALANTDSNYRPALEWFHERRGTEIRWPDPSPIPQLSHVVSKAKGIYKPKVGTLALSIRINLKSPYPDTNTVVRNDGTWVCAYHQESHDPAERDSDYTNLALMRNINTQAPIVLLRQTKEKPGSLYLVQGLAMVTGWESGLFYIEGFNDDEFARTSNSDSALDVLLGADNELLEDSIDDGNPDFTLDARRRVLGSIVVRQGGGAFRKSLLHAYNSICLISGCRVEKILDAAHIRPYRGVHTNETTNGLLIRTDLHALFDLKLLAINPDTREVLISPQLFDSEYAQYRGKRITEPADEAVRPAHEHLRAHLEWCGDQMY
jgi:putative restriction endonuclease